jgi:N-acetylmuramoyl-L-alanine amidase
MVVGLDYGHGLKTPEGAKRYTFDDGTAVFEGALNRLVALEVLDQLLDAGVTVYDLVARKKVGTVHALEDSDPSLKRRADYANSLDLDVVLSIHTNAVGRSIRGPSQPARGITVFTSPGETNADGYAAAIAGCVSGVGLRSRGTREANFYMLRRTRSPAVLVEGGFFTSLDDVQLLQDRTYRVHLASCYVRGLLQHHAERS